MLALVTVETLGELIEHLHPLTKMANFLMTITADDLWKFCGLGLGTKHAALSKWSEKCLLTTSF